MPNDDHEAREWSLWNFTLIVTISVQWDIKPGQLTKVLSVSRYDILLIHPFLYASSALPFAPMYPWE
jgi:hypothetical protein